MNAQDIKSLIIDSIDNLERLDFIANEMSFKDHGRKADLVVSRDGYLYAFEIKSKHDTLDTLNEQLEDYTKVFDYVTVVMSSSHYRKAKDIIGRNIGIWIEEDGIITIKRKPIIKKRLSKIELLSLLTLKDLKSTFPEVCVKNLTSLELKILVANTFNLETIRKSIVKKLNTLNKNSYQLFLSERGKITHTDDLPLLSRNLSKTIF